MELTVKSYGIGYGPRTGLNARSAEMTIAFAVNFGTGGERLTKKVSGDHYLAITIPFSPKKAAGTILSMMRDHNFSILNIAGNGMHTLSHHKHTQEDVNQLMYETLGIVHHVKEITKIISGGQTGIDTAGAVSAVALNIDAVITFPSGYLQRWQDGVDIKGSESEMKQQINDYAKNIKLITDWPSPTEKRQFVF